jgi:hypothetical protein
MTRNISEEKIERAKEWKDLADKYNLSMFEMYELCYHFLAIRNLLDKKTT